MQRQREPMPQPRSPLQTLPFLSFHLDGLKNHSDILLQYPPVLWIHAYTDASLSPTPNKAGLGLTIQDGQGNTVTENSTAEDPLWSITDIETWAIIRSINHSNIHEIQWQVSSMVVFTDSRASVLRLQAATRNPNHPSTLAHLFLKAATECTQYRSNEISKIAIQWIPSHAGIPGNERADELAKLQLLPKPTNNINLEAVKTSLRSATHSKWKTASRQSSAYNLRSPAHYLPRHKWHNQSLHLLPKIQQQIVMRLRLNVFPTRKRLFQLSKIPSPLCNCGALETVHHILIACNLHTSHRRQAWPQGAPPNLRKALYGNVAELKGTIKLLFLLQKSPVPV
jgi:ribonuclease HI